MTRASTGYSSFVVFPVMASGDHGAEPENHGDVEEVRPDDVGDGDVGAAASRGHTADGEFRHAGARGHDREPDHGRREPRQSGDAHRAAQEQFPATHQQRQAEHDQPDGQQHAESLTSS